MRVVQSLQRFALQRKVVGFFWLVLWSPVISPCWLQSGPTPGRTRCASKILEAWRMPSAPSTKRSSCPYWCPSSSSAYATWQHHGFLRFFFGDWVRQQWHVMGQFYHRISLYNITIHEYIYIYLCVCVILMYLHVITLLQHAFPAITSLWVSQVSICSTWSDVHGLGCFSSQHAGPIQSRD